MQDWHAIYQENERQWGQVVNGQLLFVLCSVLLLKTKLIRSNIKNKTGSFVAS